MEDRITLLHRVLLWVQMVGSLVFGLAYFFIPLRFTDFLGTTLTDPGAVRSIGGFMIGAAVGAGFCLLVNKWSETRIVTYYLITWNLLNGVGLAYNIWQENGSMSLLVNTIVCGLMAIGYTVVLWQHHVLKWPIHFTFGQTHKPVHPV
ncbi:MAG TPA: hypothetical protein VH186_39140 [Chloroflexia bacterium]|nr:hypothetical protein [Chloroflexia bacterium]